MIITIDGPAGSGKSTVAEILSKKLGFIHFNSGSIFRGVTAYLMSIDFDISSLNEHSIVNNFSVSTEYVDGVQRVYVNGTDFTSKLRLNEVSINTAYVAQCKSIREKIDECQRAFGSKNNIVIEGRDTGSFVFPNADYKFYLDCSIKERAKRRFNEEVLKNPNTSLLEIEKQIKKRDELDKNRNIAPLVIPNGAIIIDSTNLNIQQVVDELLKHIDI